MKSENGPIILIHQIPASRNGVYEMKDDKKTDGPAKKNKPKANKSSIPTMAVVDKLKKITESSKTPKPKIKKSKAINITRTINVNSLVEYCVYGVEQEIVSWQENNGDIEFSKAEREQIMKAIKEKLRA